MSTSIEVTRKDLHDLLLIFEKKSFEAGSCEEESLEYAITKKCENLFKQDYTLIELDNTNGVLSSRYPSRILIPEYEHGHMSSTLTANNSINKAAPQNGGTISNSLNQNTSSSSEDNTTLSANNPIQTYVTFANTTNVNQNQQQQQQQQPLQTQQLQYANPQNVFYYQHLLPQSSTASSSAAPSNSMTNATNNTIYEDLYDISKIRDLITMAKYARCRQRFVVPVIMYRGKYICRSATISINAETYGRKVVDYAYDYLSGSTNYNSERTNSVVDDENNDNEDSIMNQALSEPSPFSYEEVIKSDIQLLNALNVSTIVDLMVEKRKVKYFMVVSSSEKADPDNHYEKFSLLSLPYPGCEFFKKFRDNNYAAKNLYYDWKPSFNDAPISLPTLGPASDLNINWNEYKSWELLVMTQNYLKACLKYIQRDKSGILIHCISGWDRTPLFITLVRLSLWADGLIHQSLNPIQMTYFTVAYDWYLFGHQLSDRLKRGEDIMFFCFHVLKYLTGDEFSIVEHRKRTKTSSSSGSSISVLKSDNCDDESVKEDFILGYDQDSNDSFSNSSNCDMSLTDNFYVTATTTPQGSCNNLAANPITNRSPNIKRSKTSPISVPGAGATRQRHESTSSNGSWQVVTETGSIDSVMNGSFMTNYSSQNSGSSNSSREKRKEKLESVRTIFIQNYTPSVGLKFK